MASSVGSRYSSVTSRSLSFILRGNFCTSDRFKHNFDCGWCYCAGGHQGALHAGLTDVVDGAVVAAQDEEGPGGVVAADGNHILVLTTEHHTNKVK